MRPIDDDGHVSITLDRTIAVAKKAQVRWLILTPHFWRRGTNEDARVAKLAAFQAEIHERNRTRAERGDPLLIPGTEETRGDPGHIGLSWYDIREAWDARGEHGGSLALSAHARGALVVLNHPFATFGFDMTWKPWTAAPAKDAEAALLTERAQAIECYNRMLAIGDAVLGRQRDRRQCDRAFAAIDRAGVDEGRKIVGLGGSDNHNYFFMATTWALVRGPLTEDSLKEALLAGRVVCGETPAAASFEGASDRAAGWVPPGSAIAADREVRLRWRGTAEVWRDGVLLGTHEDGYTDEIAAGSRHVYRIVIARRSWSNPIYVNLDATPRAAVY
jgi:hypothetical protein